jgi:hypothetical protein
LELLLLQVLNDPTGVPPDVRQRAAPDGSQESRRSIGAPGTPPGSERWAWRSRQPAFSAPPVAAPRHGSRCGRPRDGDTATQRSADPPACQSDESSRRQLVFRNVRCRQPESVELSSDQCGFDDTQRARFWREVRGVGRRHCRRAPLEAEDDGLLLLWRRVPAAAMIRLVIITQSEGYLGLTSIDLS